MPPMCLHTPSRSPSTPRLWVLSQICHSRRTASVFTLQSPQLPPTVHMRSVLIYLPNKVNIAWKCLFVPAIVNPLWVSSTPIKLPLLLHPAPIVMDSSLWSVMPLNRVRVSRCLLIFLCSGTNTCSTLGRMIREDLRSIFLWQVSH